MADSKSLDLGVHGVTDAVEVGRGGFATVYRAFQPAFERYVAVKVFSDLALDEATKSTFERECRAIGRLSGRRNILTVYDAGINANGQPYMVMPFMAGGSLEDRLERRGPLPWQEAVDIGVKIGKALQAAHDAGVLHRDVKPDNVLTSEDGEPELADFGIARLTDRTRMTRSSLSFTPAHVAPEVLAGGQPTPAVDVYSLGSTLFTLIAGRPAFLETPDDSVFVVMRRVEQSPVPDLLRPLGVPDGVCAAIEDAMAKSVEQRPASAREFADRLQRAGETRRSEPAAATVVATDFAPASAPAQPHPAPGPTPTPAPVPATTTSPGWYADPSGAPGMRYWDGATWGATAPASASASGPPPANTSGPPPANTSGPPPANTSGPPRAPALGSAPPLGRPSPPMGYGQPPAPASPRKSRRWLWIALGAVGVIVVVAVIGLLATKHGSNGSSGSDSGLAPLDSETTSPPTTPSPTNIANLAVGDCFTGGNLGGSQITDVTVVDCSSPHDGQLIAFQNNSSPAGADFPGSHELNTESANFCNSAFQSYVGVSVSASSYHMTNLFPVESGWKTGDRWEGCAVTASSGQLTGSVEGTAK